MNIEEVLDANFIKDLIHEICGDGIDLIKRPASYMIRNVVEGDRDMRRLIFLPPRGYTADQINQMNSHDEAEYATIEIKGAIRSQKNGFSVLKNCLLVASIPQNGKVSSLNKPYMLFEIEGDTNPDLTLVRHSAGTAPFTVVKSDGYGFYHNLINLTDDWLVLQLYKKLRPQKPVDLQPHFKGLLKGQAESLQKLYDAVLRHGDGVYKTDTNLIENIVRMPVQQVLPALIEMLYIHDTGRHEACSVFAVILKLGKMHPDLVKQYLRNAIEANTVPAYYAKQLIDKIDRWIAQEDRGVSKASAA